MGENQIEYFNGKIGMVKVFDSLLNPPQLSRLTKVTSKWLDDG